jgi:hypothetical protein
MRRKIYRIEIKKTPFQLKSHMLAILASFIYKSFSKKKVAQSSS